MPDNAPTDLTVSALAVPVAPFRESNPSSWFAQIEATFALRGIQSDVTKYFHVVAALPPHIVDEVDDLVNAEEKSYKTLKAAIIQRVGLSDRQRIAQLLSRTELGDRKPSQLLREMQRLAGCAAKDDKFLREMWLQRLPREVQAILNAASDMPLSQAAEQADRIMETLRPRLHNVASTSSDAPTLAAVMNRMDDLAREIQTLKVSNHSRRANRSPSRHGNRPRSRSVGSNYDQESTGLCWYHYTHGARARNCRAPCTFSKKAQGNA